MPSALVSDAARCCFTAVLDTILRAGVGQERRGPSYFFISFVLGPLSSLSWYVPSSRYIWSSAPILFLQEQIKTSSSSAAVSARTNKDIIIIGCRRACVCVRVYACAYVRVYVRVCMCVCGNTRAYDCKSVCVYECVRGVCVNLPRKGRAGSYTNEHLSTHKQTHVHTHT
jgi:hypothetical protein